MSLPLPRLRLAIVASHPVQYYAAWYRALADVVDLHVFFAHRVTGIDHARSGFGVEFEWDVPVLDGYQSTWLDNIAARPGPDHFLGCNTPEIGSKLARGGFDAVLVTGWNLLTYWQAIRAARRQRIPVMVRGDSQLPTRRAAVVRAAKRLAYPWLLRSFDAYLAVGSRSAEYYRHYGAAADRIFLSPHSVDNAFFGVRSAAVRPRRLELRRALGIPIDAVVFALAGKLIDKKRPLDFMKAVHLAGRTESQVCGLVIGDGPLRPVIEAESRVQPGRCVLIGFMNQQRIVEAYAAADALVLASDARETWGLVVNEAMACSLPVIATDAAGCTADLVIHGTTGFTFACGRIDALAGCMNRIAADRAQREAMGRRAAEWIRAFSPEAAAAGVVRALETLIARDHPRHSKAGRHAFDAAS
jgi:glycosyltransferase involved in cell wall biosynthesis